MAEGAATGSAGERNAVPARSEGIARERQQRLQAAVRRGVLTQGAIAGFGAAASLIWMLPPDLSVWARGVGIWLTLTIMLGALVWGLRRTVFDVMALYRQSIQRLEQEINNAVFRASISSVQDKATGVYTYEFFASRLREEVDRAQRYSRALSLLLVDPNDFRMVNDRYGREIGNQILRRFAINIVRSSLRSSDIVARYSGDQFVVLLPETDRGRARIAANRITERAMQGTQLPDGVRLALPVHIGIASAPQDGITADRLLQAAESALRASKSSN